MLKRPRLTIAGLSGGSGKTLVSLGLCRAWEKQGLQVQAFKKGPDYIDAAWLGLAARRAAVNLDPFFLPAEQLIALFQERSALQDVSLIEGNRGLFDGMDVEGSASTAELVKLLQCPIVLVVNCTKMTRTTAALVHGCNSFDPDTHLAGVIFNQTAGERHRSLLRASVERYTDVPVLGALPRLKENPIPERHMGLISDREFQADGVLDALAATVSENVDTGVLLNIARRAEDISAVCELIWPAQKVPQGSVRIGVIQDAALWFYYDDNIESLRRAGAEIVTLSLLSKDPWPKIDGLYLGGGFPETQAEQLAANIVVRDRVRGLAEQGLPIYAECGGLMYLGRSLKWGDREFPMANVFPITTVLCARPQGHGYTTVEVTAENPYHPMGATIRGHEFHYSKILEQDRSALTYAFRVARGKGVGNGFDGIMFKNTFASYTHLHALGTLHWAERFVETCRDYRSSIQA